MMCPCRRWMLLDKNLGQRPMGLPQTSPSSAESKVGLEVMPIDGMTLSDGHGPKERTPTRLIETSG